MITDSQALLNTGQIIFGIIVIGIIGLISDFLFKWRITRSFRGPSNNGPPRLRAAPLRCPLRGSNSRLGTALRAHGASEPPIDRRC